jgi:hypothetical protein
VVRIASKSAPQAAMNFIALSMSLGELLVARVRRVGDEALVPVVDVAQVGEATGGEGPHEVEGGAARVVRPHKRWGSGYATAA